MYQYKTKEELMRKKNKHRGEKKFYVGYLAMVEKQYGRKVAENLEKFHPKDIQFEP